jgi:hypothetical protein
MHTNTSQRFWFFFSGSGYIFLYHFPKFSADNSSLEITRICYALSGQLPGGHSGCLKTQGKWWFQDWQISTTFCGFFFSHQKIKKLHVLVTFLTDLPPLTTWFFIIANFKLKQKWMPFPEKIGFYQNEYVKKKQKKKNIIYAQSWSKCECIYRYLFIHVHTNTWYS